MVDIWQETDLILKNRAVPIHVIVEITRRCNLDCLHCYNTKDDREIPGDQWPGVLEQLREAGCLFLTLTGGEIFARQDIVGIIASARRMGFDIKLMTNGSLITPQIAARLKDLHLSEIGVSLQGATAATHDRITQVKGSFQRTLTAIRGMKEIGLPVHLKCTLMRENIHEYPAVKDLAQALGVIYIIDPIISPRDDGSTDNLVHRLTECALQEFYAKELGSLEEETPGPGLFPCDAGSTFAAISASGDVYPCIQLPVPVGNVFEQRFADIWQGASLLKSIRDPRPEQLGACRSCPQATSCFRCPGLAYLEKGDLFGPSTTACLIAEVTQRCRS